MLWSPRDHPRRWTLHIPGDGRLAVLGGCDWLAIDGGQDALQLLQRLPGTVITVFGRRSSPAGRAGERDTAWGDDIPLPGQRRSRGD